MPRNVFHRRGVALDITRGNPFLRFDLRERQGADQEIVHAKAKRSAPPAFRARAGAAGHCPRLFHQSGSRPQLPKKAAAAGFGWPLPEGWDEKRIEEALFGNRRPIERRPRALPDFPALKEQFQRHPHLTLQLAWEEYRQVHPDGYGYSRFCELYQRWRKKQDVVLRQNHTPGEKGFVDWAGRTIPIQDPQTGEVHGAALFLMVLGASNYTYAEATLDQQMAAWLGCHIHAFEYFGAVPRLLVPDNTRTGVSRACRYDPDLNPTYQEMAMHYGIGVVPARPYHPRDKAKAEAGVLVAERWIIAALRHRTFFRLEDLNH